MGRGGVSTTEAIYFQLRTHRTSEFAKLLRPILKFNHFDVILIFIGISNAWFTFYCDFIKLSIMFRKKAAGIIHLTVTVKRISISDTKGQSEDCINTPVPSISKYQAYS